MSVPHAAEVGGGAIMLVGIALPSLAARRTSDRAAMDDRATADDARR